MGKLLLRIYRIVEDKGGLQGRLTLALKTGISQQQAAVIRDKAEIVKRVRKTATEILGQDIDDFLK
ncbi:MAG: hypothetical protein NTW95_00590 [Candidatus Aminicenantes bacterium]|nr:hypothetical protein [Candidatus Aminicenantes bacterium]